MNEDFPPPYVGDPLDFGDGVTVGRVEVTPELAAAWLKRNTHNRSISDNTVRGYVRDVLADDWPFTGDPVRFSDDGVLLDGQHRLKALVKTETTMTMLVVSGLGVRTQEYMDGGRKRSPFDVLAIEKIPNYTAVASVARLALRWNPGGMWVEGRGTSLVGESKVTTAQIMSFVREHEGIHEAARVGLAVYNAIPGSRPSVIGAAFLRAAMLEDGVFPAAEWFKRLETGVGLETGSPILALRDGLIRSRLEKLSNPQVPQLWKVVRAWNATRDGQSMNRIILPVGGLSNDTFPDMR